MGTRHPGTQESAEFLGGFGLGSGVARRLSHDALPGSSACRGWKIELSGGPLGGSSLDAPVLEPVCEIGWRERAPHASVAPGAVRPIRPTAPLKRRPCLLVPERGSSSYRAALLAIPRLRPECPRWLPR